MRKTRFTDEKMVRIIREADKAPVAEVTRLSSAGFSPRRAVSDFTRTGSTAGAFGAGATGSIMPDVASGGEFKPPPPKTLRDDATLLCERLERQAAPLPRFEHATRLDLRPFSARHRTSMRSSIADERYAVRPSIAVRLPSHTPRASISDHFPCAIGPPCAREIFEAETGIERPTFCALRVS